MRRNTAYAYCALRGLYSGVPPYGLLSGWATAPSLPDVCPETLKFNLLRFHHARNLMPTIKSSNSWCVEFASHEQKYEYEKEKIPRKPAHELSSMLQALIDADPTEEEVQQFFEQYPRCLPEAGHYHNGLRADVVISKLPLHNDFITDFAYMSQNSQRVLIICIEIERPGKIFSVRMVNLPQSFKPQNSK
jgi:hypothetical protein